MDSIQLLFRVVFGFRIGDLGIVQVSGSIYQDARSRNGRYPGGGSAGVRVVFAQPRLDSAAQIGRCSFAVLDDKPYNDSYGGQSQPDPGNQANG